MTSDRRIDDFIAEHRERLTREAITQQLEAAGYARADIDAAWQRALLAAPVAGTSRRSLATYVWVIYWLGAAIIAAYALVVIVSSGGGGFLPFGMAWLLLYLAIAYLPAWALARTRSSSLVAIVAVVVAAPVIVLVIGGGICAATVAVLLNSMGY